MNTAYLLLGSNTGDSRLMLNHAAQYIWTTVGPIKNASAVYRTAAWGDHDQPDFLNRILVIETSFTAEQTLGLILLCEKHMGRARTFKNAPRIIDIDILFFNDEVIDSAELTIPHPEIQNRRFVLEPMAEIAPALIHPVFHKTLHQLLQECTDRLNVQKI